MGYQMPFCNYEQCFGTHEQFFAPMVGVILIIQCFLLKKYNLTCQIWDEI